MSIVNTLYVIILVTVVTVVHAGCYSPLALSVQRSQAGIAVDKLNNKIYFVGGTGLGFSASPRVDVLDLTTDTWTSFELSEPRANVHAFVYESRIVLAGRTQGREQIDIYFPSNGTLVTLPLTQRNTPSSAYIVGSNVYYLSLDFQPRIAVLDLLTNTITKEFQLTISRADSAATNGTHIFILSTYTLNSQLSILSMDTLQLTSVALTLPLSRHLFLVDSTTLILLMPNQIMRVDFLRSIVYSDFPPVTMVIDGAIQVGSDIYVLSPNQLTVISILRSEVTQYAMGVSPFTDVLSTVEWKGRIYFSAMDSAESILTINTKVLLQSYEELGRPLLNPFMNMAINGFYFMIPNIGSKLQYLKLGTGQAFSYDLVYDSFARGVVTVDDSRLVVLSREKKVYYMFDTVTETWISDKINTDTMQYLATDPISLNDLAVFKPRDFCYIFNTTSREWTWFAAGGNVMKAVDNSLAFLSWDGTIQLYNVYSKQWITNIPKIQMPMEYTVTIGTHRNLLFIAGGVFMGQYLNDVIVLDSTDGSIRHVYLSTPRGYIEFLGSGDYVIFASGSSPLASPAIDILNVVTFQWRTLSLHQTPLGRVAMVPWKNRVFFTLPGAVELLDLTAMTLQQMAIPFKFPLPLEERVTGGSFGTKIVLFGTTSNGVTASFYESSTRQTASFSIEFLAFPRQQTLLMTRNYIIAVVNGIPRVLQFAAIENDLYDTELFYGDAMTFNVTAKGVDLTSQWYHNTAPLLGETQTALNVNNVTQSSEGIYSIRVVDQCNQVMTRQANLIVHGPPVIIDELAESIIMCHEKATLSTRASGEQKTYNWTIGSLTQPSHNSTITVTGESFECNTSHQLCVSVTNPSGSTSQCTTVRIVNHDSVFSGPRQLSSLPLLIRETDVDLEVSLLDDECESHEWVVNGVKTGIRGERTSVVTVHLDQNTTSQSFRVIAQCGNSELTSRPFSFTNVSSLNVRGLVLVVVACFVVLVGALLTAYFVRRRAIASHKAEVELESLLNQAKAETLNRDGVPILKSTTWEWSPNEQFTFKPINKMSFALDSTALASLSKHEPVKVGVWNQNIISFSSLRGSSSTKTKRTNVLKERLIGGTHVDIYAPRSPKYEIKIEPSSFDIDDSDDTPIHVTVSSMMRITSKCKVGLIVVCSQEQVYSIVEFKLTSAMSTWIDLDEIEMTGDYLGGGGFGSVTRGVYRGQDVAVKKLLSQYLTPEMHIEFEREIMLMKDLHHPNIVQFVGASNIKDSLAIVIEYAPLGSLASVLEKHSLTLNMKMTMLLESAKALQFLHANGIIHRDIKPQNILVFSLEPKSPVHIKLTDFGTARLISEEAMTVTKNIGTISFMAPESLGKNPRIEKSADVYSFALLMWSVLFEQTPFSEFKWDSDLEAHVKQGHRLPFPSDQNIDGALTSLISECWEHSANKRPSMATVVQRLTVLSSTLK